jgi:hypothetical protein
MAGRFPGERAVVPAIVRLAILVAIAIPASAIAYSSRSATSLGHAAASLGDAATSVGDATTSVGGPATSARLISCGLASGGLTACDPGPIENRVRALREIRDGVRGSEVESPDPERTVRDRLLRR